MKRILIYFLLLVLVSCSDSALDKWTIHKIPKGQHFSYVIKGNKSPLFNGRHMKFDAKFNATALYDTAGMGVDAYDINKLYGFTAGDFDNNSVRIGWVHLSGDEIQIWAYWHRAGDFDYHPLGVTHPSKVDQYELWVEDTIYKFRFNNVTFTTEGSAATGGIRTRQYPYFGGNKVSPQDITIDIYEYK